MSDTAAYGVLEPGAVHFDDLDAFGMLYNSHYAVLAERAWVAYWQRREVAYSSDWKMLDDGFNVAKELLVGFDAPIDRPGTYGVHLWVERLGRTSLTYGFRVCSPDGSRTYAHGRRTVVRLDRGTLRPAPWSERARELCTALLRPGAEED
ncbi:acyl-CoA thioesterase [Streptomyces fuscigenes]|uniref:acyl-CoA thioesterase n=1 Tax=Streptomyces fuscigenes TaxID=1528880 RepID=UPI001F33F465|nr:thioesterase family protein [Streptomyces fuscigenes]MCF3965537.1 acyl-CoA thioesterase [Streptomyces fuscigenes]